MRLAINTIRTIQLLASIGLLAISSCSSNEKKETQDGADTAIRVTVSQPGADFRQGLTLSGQVESTQTANISTRIMGFITKIYVKVGDRVSKGQLLATINNDDILAKRAQTDAIITEADAGFKNAQKDYDRFNALYKQQSASAKELDNVTLQYSSAKARLEAAKQQRNEVNAMLSYTNLTAPFAGTVSQKLVDAGGMANPGMPLLIIEQSDSYQINASVPENEISLIREGISVDVRIGAINRSIKGTVSQINQSSQNTGGQYMIKVHIPDNEKQDLFSGMYANILIPVPQTVKSTATSQQIMVPLSAIEYKDQLTGLYTVGSNHTALLRWVRLGKTEGDKVEVLSGLAVNDQFIVSAEGRLYNGVAVKIK